MTHIAEIFFRFELLPIPRLTLVPHPITLLLTRINLKIIDRKGSKAEGDRIHSDKFRGEDIKRRKSDRGSPDFAGCWGSLAVFRVGRNLENFRD